MCVVVRPKRRMFFCYFTFNQGWCNHQTNQMMFLLQRIMLLSKVKISGIPKVYLSMSKDWGGTKWSKHIKNDFDMSFKSNLKIYIKISCQIRWISRSESEDFRFIIKLKVGPLFQGFPASYGHFEKTSLSLFWFWRT